MYLDNALIERGDKVFDVVMGWGEVKYVLDRQSWCTVREVLLLTLEISVHCTGTTLYWLLLLRRCVVGG
jgi:hypothetical protein